MNTSERWQVVLQKAWALLVKLIFLKGYPFLENDEELTDKSKQLAKDYLGEGNVIDLDIWMAAEDFAYYSQEMDACFYRLGTRNESKGIVSGVHTPTFDIDEEALEIGPGLMAWITLNLLNEK
jgi:metal-dependent amidase/aminoacylase/carboxypeptidase family protein